MDSIPLRTATSDEYQAYRAAFATVFAFEPKDEDSEDFRKWLEWDRSFLAEDGGRIVATGGAVSYRLTVPGGARLGAGGLTVIAVQPTHRRRGLLRSMINRHFDDCIARGEPLSILWASESSIYGRFGYGLSVEMRDLAVERRHLTFRTDLPEPAGTYRFLSLDEAKEVVPGVQLAATAGRNVPGSIEARQVDWDTNLTDYEHRRRGASRLHFVAYDRDGETRGYARYRLKADWDVDAKGKVMVHEVHAVDGEAYAALWRFLGSIDLMSEIEAYNRPPGDPLYRLLADPRRVSAKGLDALWTRILDVPAALGSRHYGREGSLVIEVVDEFRPECGGRFLLEGGPEGAECRATDQEPDVRIPVDHLGAAYLGAPRLGDLGWLGMLDCEPEALALADAMFQWPLAPATFVHF